MKRVKCKSGLTGWQERLRKVYHNFEEFEAYCETWSISERLGYETPEEAWDANPIIQGSTDPSDCCVVLDGNNKVNFIREEVELVFKNLLQEKITQEQFLKKLHSFDNRLKRLFGTKGNKSIWFRLFNGDTLATTIRSIENEFENPYSNNYKHFFESVEIGVNETGMEVYFS